MARRRGNPLALAVLACLTERPMHPYEMAATMRTRGQDASIRLNYGSLYGVVETLLKRGLIEEQEVVREGRRPERTVYRITDDGRGEVDDWLAELLGTPAKEFPRFEAGLSLMGVLPPERVIDLLDQRVGALRSGFGARRHRRGRHGQRRPTVVPGGDGLRARARGSRLRVHRTVGPRHRVGTSGRGDVLEELPRRPAGTPRPTSTRRRQVHERDRGSRGHHPLVRRDPGPARRRPRRARGRCRRPARTQRCGQDHARPHPLDPDRTRRAAPRASPASTW